MTPEMIFRCADQYREKKVSRDTLKKTISTLGIKLTQHELTRLEYLLDEDISGEISYDEYNAYLIAFGIKGEYSSTDLFMKNLLKKIKIDQALLEDEDGNPKKKYRQLLTYEEFLKYCHKNFPNLKDKEIGAIFNLLQKDNKIDLQEFLDYIFRQDEQKRKLDKKNKKKESIESNVEEIDDPNSLKWIFKMLLKNRPKEGRHLFHSVEFSKVEKVLNKNRGELLQLFKQIDKKKKGSFGFNELIQFYLSKETKGDILFTYELMGHKISHNKEDPEDILHRYNKNSKSFTISEFYDFMWKEFEITEKSSEPLFLALCPKDKELSLETIINAMKLKKSNKIIYIKPTSWKTFYKDFWKKECFTILFNPFVALRFCIQICEEMQKIRQKYWDDYEFGPTYFDQSGVDSIGYENITQEELKWNTIESLGFNDFYIESEDEKYHSPVTCPHEMFVKALMTMNKESKNFLWNKDKIDYNVKTVEESHLKHIFEGVYPLIFHSFASAGIYVFRFFVRDKWAYVMVDNKIPCNLEDKPYFTSSKEKKLSWISLIEKAYAKIKGSYNNMYNLASNKSYIHELTSKLPIDNEIPREMTTPEMKDGFWQKMLDLESKRNNSKLYALTSESAAAQLMQNKVETGFTKNTLNEITNFIEIFDDKCKNSHKSHRLALMKVGNLLNENIWNPNWNKYEDETNKYDTFEMQIMEEMKKKKNELLPKDVTVLNYKLFRNIFNQLFFLKPVDFEKMIILRKIVEFEQNFTCKYELSSKTKDKSVVPLFITLRRINSPHNSSISLCLAPEKDEKKKKDSKVESEKNEPPRKFYSHGELSTVQLDISAEKNVLEIKVENWERGSEYVYLFTFYFSSAEYHMKELDRQILFKYVSPYEEAYFLDLKEADEQERKYIYRNYFKAAERSGGCCG